MLNVIHCYNCGCHISSNKSNLKVRLSICIYTKIWVTIWGNTACESARYCLWKVLRYSTFQHFCAVKYLFTNQFCFTFLLQRHLFSLHSTEGPMLFILPLVCIHLTTLKNTNPCRLNIVNVKAVADNFHWYKEINSICNVFYTECAFKKNPLKS